MLVWVCPGLVGSLGAVGRIGSTFCASGQSFPLEGSVLDMAGAAAVHFSSLFDSSLQIAYL